MKLRRYARKRILAVDPTHRGFGYVVLEEPDRLVDWGLCLVRSRKEVATLVRVRRLIRHLEPEVVVVEDTRHPGCRRGQRVRDLLDGIAAAAAELGVASSRIPAAEVRQSAATIGVTNKDAVAKLLSARFPELEPLLPPRRKTWVSEDERMAVFDSIALAIAFSKVGAITMIRTLTTLKRYE